MIETKKFVCNSICDGAVDIKDYPVGKPMSLLNPCFNHR